MLTPVERVLVLKGADLLKDVGPRHLVALADVAREIEAARGDILFGEDDPADVLYVVVEGRVKVTARGRVIHEVGPGEAFGTWALVDDSGRGQRAECEADALLLALHRDDFYEIAAGDLTLLQELVRALAKRLRELVSTPEEAHVETAESQEAIVETAAELAAEMEPAAAVEPLEAPEEVEPAADAGATLRSAALGQPPPRPAEDAENR